MEDVKNSNTPGKGKVPSTTEQKIKRRNLISFATFFLFTGAVFKGWNWLYQSEMEAAGVTAEARKPLRKALNKTEVFFRNFFSHNHLVKTYPKSMAARKVRVNSEIGIDDADFNVETWKLLVVKSRSEVLILDLNEIRSLPKSEIVFDFKCVEGWDQIQHWGGVKMIDFIGHYKLTGLAKMDYMGLQTPNGEYYVGLDMESALHPQTILAYEMNGLPLLPEHGAPLRLIIPVKYGIKNLKRIGTMTFSNHRPRDYWAENGYDYYSGL